MNLITVGIDPGKHGAFFSIAQGPNMATPLYRADPMPVIIGETHDRHEMKVVDGKRRRLKVLDAKGKVKKKKDKDLPDWEAIARLFREQYAHASVYYVERVSGGQSFGKAQSGSFNFGETYGFVCGLILGNGGRIVRVPASVWKPHFGLGNKEDKEASRRLATSMFDPAHCREDSTPFRFDRVKDDGVAEAGLIAYYGRLQEQLKEL